MSSRRLSLILSVAVLLVGANLALAADETERVPCVDEAAMMDGAGPVRRFIHITIPLLLPTILFVMVISLLSAVKVFLNPLVMTGGGTRSGYWSNAATSTCCPSWSNSQRTARSTNSA